jgi:hypothetical protein
MQPLQGCSKGRGPVFALHVLGDLLRRKRSQSDRASHLLPRKLPTQPAALTAAIALNITQHKVT